MLAFSWLPWQHGEIKSRRDGPRTGNRHFILKKVKFYSRSRKKVTVLNLFYKGAVNAYFLTGSFFKKTVVFEAAIFVGQPEDGAEVRCEVSRRVEPAVSRYSGPSGLRFMVCPARRPLLTWYLQGPVVFRKTERWSHLEVESWRGWHSALVHGRGQFSDHRTLCA